MSLERAGRECVRIIVTGFDGSEEACAAIEFAGRARIAERAVIVNVWTEAAMVAAPTSLSGKCPNRFRVQRRASALRTSTVHVGLAANTEITPRARKLIARHVDSVGALDLLLLLHADPHRAWAVAELCTALRCPDGWARRELGRLIAAGLISESSGGSHQLAVASPCAGAVDDLERAYRDDPGAVVRLLFRLPGRR